MLDIFINTFRVLLRKKGRTLLTLAGIAVGIASVIVINTVSRCGSEAVSGEIDGLGMGGIIISLEKPSARLGSTERELIQSLPYVEYAMPLVFETTDAYIRNEKSEVYLWGIDKSAKDVISLKLENGRFINSGDISSASKVCMIDSAFAKKSFGTVKAAGKTITLHSGSTSSEYTVAGVIRTGSGLLQNVMGSYMPAFVYLPYTTMQNNLGSSNFTQIAVRLADGVDNARAGKNIISALERETGMKGAYTYSDLAQQKENIGNIIGIFTAVLSAIGMISLLVAGLSIMNVMLVSVTEQTKIIGIKKALGASRSMVVLEFLFEAVILTLTGGIIGAAAGIVLSAVGAAMLGLTWTLGIDIIIHTLIFSIAVGVVFGIYPALKAARLRPVDALRNC